MMLNEEPQVNIVRTKAKFCAPPRTQHIRDHAGFLMLCAQTVQETLEFVRFDVIEEIVDVSGPVNKERLRGIYAALRKPFDIDDIVPSSLHDFHTILAPDGSDPVWTKVLWNKLPKILWIIHLMKKPPSARILSAE